MYVTKQELKDILTYYLNLASNSLTPFKDSLKYAHLLEEPFPDPRTADYSYCFHQLLIYEMCSDIRLKNIPKNTLIAIIEEFNQYKIPVNRQYLDGYFILPAKSSTEAYPVQFLDVTNISPSNTADMIHIGFQLSNHWDYAWNAEIDYVMISPSYIYIDAQGNTEDDDDYEYALDTEQPW